MTGEIAVIGAGYAGLACAVELARAGERVVVFESGRVLGGRARVLERDGYRLDNGQHILIGAYTELLRLLRLVGVSPRALETRRLCLEYPGHLRLQAAPLPAPLHLAWGLAAARGLGPGGRRAAARLLRHLKRTGFDLPTEQTVAQLLDTTNQPSPLRPLVWEALCYAALNTPPESASARIFAHVLRDSLAAGAHASDLLIPRVDLSELFPVPAARYLARHGGRVEVAAPIRGVAAEDAGFRLHGDHRDRRFAQVVIATAPYHATALLPAAPELEALRNGIDALPYEPITTVYLAFDSGVRLPQPMVGVAKGCAQWLFDRGQLAGPSGMIAAVISAHGPHESLDRDELIAAVLADIAAIVGPLPPLAWHQAITERRATIAARPGLARPGNQTATPGLWLAGDYLASDYPATLESAVRSGVQCARQIRAAGARR